MRRLITQAALLTTLASSAGGAMASVIFDSFSAPSPNIITSYNINLGGSPQWTGLAQSFTTAAGPITILNSVNLRLNRNGSSGVAGETVSVALYADLGNAPGSLLVNLGSIAASSLTGAFSDNLLLGPSIGLNPGTRYWIELNDSASNVAWAAAANATGTGVAGESAAFLNASGGHTTLPAFQMQLDASTATTGGPSVPEPSSLWLAGLALAAAVGQRGMTRRARRPR